MRSCYATVLISLRALRGNTISSLSVKRGEKWYRTRTTPAEISRSSMWQRSLACTVYVVVTRHDAAQSTNKRDCVISRDGGGERNPRKKTKIFGVIF